MTTTEKLECLKNRGTRYELTCTVPDGRTCLAGYTRRSKIGILTMLRKNGEAWAARIPENARIEFEKNGQSVKIGPFHIRFSGRTQRDAICGGELQWFEEDIPVN